MRVGGDGELPGGEDKKGPVVSQAGRQDEGGYAGGPNKAGKPTPPQGEEGRPRIRGEEAQGPPPLGVLAPGVARQAVCRHRPKVAHGLKALGAGAKESRPRGIFDKGQGRPCVGLPKYAAHKAQKAAPIGGLAGLRKDPPLGPCALGPYCTAPGPVSPPSMREATPKVGALGGRGGGGGEAQMHSIARGRGAVTGADKKHGGPP